jgi:hypothetical protein
MRFPDSMTKAKDDGEVVSLTPLAALTHRKYTWY